MEADIFICNYLIENECAKKKYFAEHLYSKLLALNTNFFLLNIFFEVHKFWLQR
jgi:hypothetical protein